MIQAIRKYTGMVKIAIRERVQYRFDFLTSLLAAAMYSVLYFLLWKAIYRYTPHPVMQWPQLITYILIGQVINLARFSPAERVPIYKMTQQIREGDIALELIKPVSFQVRRFVEAVGYFGVETLWVNLPLLVLSILFFHILLPPNLWAALGFLASLGLAFFVAFALNTITLILAFWTTNTFGTQMAKRALVEICSGALIPFEFFPSWARAILTHLPFQSLAYIPLSIYTGRIHGSAIFSSLTEQLIWAGAILALCHGLWLLASRRITIYGG